MKIKMLKTFYVLGTIGKGGRGWGFHKGRKYSAMMASNQPNFRKDGKIFAEKKNGESILLHKGEYEII